MTDRARLLRAPLVDVALALAIVVWAVVETLGNDVAPHPAVRAALAGATAASVALRRIAPTPAAAVFALGMTAESLTTEAPDEVAVLLACVLVSWSVAVHAPRRQVWLDVTLVALAVSVAIATDPSDSVSNVVPTVALFVAIPFGAGWVLRRRQQDVESLRLETEALAREAEAAVDLERRRIARELHDVVSHAVTLIAVQAEAGQAVIDTDPAGARRSLEAIGRVSREALDELHRLLEVLREEAPTLERGLDGLGPLVEGTRAAGLSVAVDGTAPPGLAGEVDRCAYRVVQESLTNALRHTADARVRIVLAGDDGHLDVEVRSEGRRHASSYGGSGRGLAGLRERVLALGGTFTAEPVGDHGFRVHARLPVAS